MNETKATYEGGCHCGAVRFRVRVERHVAIDCNCSICTKKGYLHVIVGRDDFELLRGADATTTYRFHTGVARHEFCATCGIHSHYVPRSHPDGVDVNARCLDDGAMARFVVERFDGRDWDAAIAKLRTDPWPSVDETHHPGVDPLAVFRGEYGLAQRTEAGETTACTLATVDADGTPSARVVLVKGLDERGFQFFTNYDSRKSRALAASGRAALSFHWPGLHRQVRVEGAVERVTPEESDAYFATRHRGSQVGAWASRQSQAAASRAEIDARVVEMTARFDGKDVPRPPNWGGFRLVPARIEFWYGRESRLHDRFVYEREADGWRVTRLWP